jgi:hypothetical protein
MTPAAAGRGRSRASVPDLLVSGPNAVADEKRLTGEVGVVGTGLRAGMGSYFRRVGWTRR